MMTAGARGRGCESGWTAERCQIAGARACDREAGDRAQLSAYAVPIGCLSRSCHLLIASLALLATIAANVIDVEPSMLLGQATRESKTLLSEDAEGFYALQLTTRDNRLCQVRAFFRGSSPRTARYCSGRVTGRQVARSGVAVLGVGEVVQGIGACLSSDRRIIAVRFYTRAGAEVTAQTETCTGGYQQVRCRGDWVVQGVQLYFGGASWMRPQPSLQGLRPLCTAPAMP